MAITGNYTISKCVGTATPGSFPQISAGYTNPDNPSMDKGHCDQDRHQLANGTMSYMTPTVTKGLLGALASDWRLSGILTMRSGAWLNITTGLDNAMNGISNQRPNQISDDVYGAKTLGAYLNRAAFSQPALGTFGNLQYRAIEGPGYWDISMAVSRILNMGNMRTLELRMEAFNLTNNFNWGDPATNINLGTFGRITSMAGTPRIMQFGIKYGF